MRNGVAAAAGAVLTSVFVAGCGGGVVGEEPENPTAKPDGSFAPAPSSETKESERTAPAKSVDLADKCSIVTEEQARSLGADQPPRKRDSNGVPVCNYDQGESGAGFQVIVGVDDSETMQEFAEMRKSRAEPTEIADYPAVEVPIGGTNCYISVDISDRGSLFVGSQPLDAPDEPCELATKFAEVAVKNLPDA